MGYPPFECHFADWDQAFNARGQFLGETSEGSFALAGPGEITASGEYVAASDAGHTATIVNCKVGDVTGTARVRVVPPLPWKFDFDEDKVRRVMTLKLEHARPKADAIETLFEDVYQVIDHLGRTVDAFGKKGDV